MVSAQGLPGLKPMSNDADRVNWKALFVLSAVVVLLDQLTKHFAASNFQIPIAVLPFFNLVLAHNAGAAFSFLADAGGWQRYLFTGISSVVSIVLMIWIFRLKKHELMLGVALAFILGGAVGNLYDRAVMGYVIDFLDFHWGGWHFPAFNLADSAICFGAGLMLLDMLLHPQN